MPKTYAHLSAKIDTGLHSKLGPRHSPDCRSPRLSARPSSSQKQQLRIGTHDLRSPNVSSIRDDKELHKGAKVAVQREMRSTTQGLRRTCADMKRLQTQKHQLDSQLQKTARDQERCVLKREDFLRTLQAKERTIDQSLLLRAKEEGELVERLTYLKRQLGEDCAKLSSAGTGNEGAMRHLRAENKRLREQMRSLMENATALNNRIPLHPMRIASAESQEFSLTSNADGASLGRMTTTRLFSANNDTWSQRVQGCPLRFAPPPRANRHVSRSLSPGAFSRTSHRKQLDPPRNLTVRFVSGHRISTPIMHPLPTVHLETPRDAIDPRINLRAAVGCKRATPVIPITPLVAGRLDLRSIMQRDE